MNLNIQKLMRDGREPAVGSVEFDFSSHDFMGFCVEKPVKFSFVAQPEENAVKLTFHLEALIQADCARCLDRLSREQVVDKTYLIHAADLLDEFPELPLVGAELDLEELAYGELVLEVPQVMVCSEDCQGLCAQCGKRSEQCECPQQETGDPRLQILKQLLN